MTKITLPTVGNLIDATTAQTTINSNFATIQTAFDNTFSRNGLAPNTMTADVDMNSQRLLNLPQPITAAEPLRLADVATLTGGGTISINPIAGANISVTGTPPSTTIAVVPSPSFTGVTVTGLAASSAVQTDGSKALTTIANTGTGSNVLATSPALVTPNLGIATATTVNRVTITAPATGATLTIPDGTTLTGPAASGTAMTLGNTETVTGVKTFGSAGAVGRFKLAGTTSGTTVLDASATASGTLTLPATTDTLVGKATTDTFTNKTYDTAGTGNSFSINGVAANANSGTGAIVRVTSPALVTPALGAATATTINGAVVSPGHLTGEPTTGSALAGEVGELVVSNIVGGSAITLTSGVAATITSIILTAGDWDIEAMGCFTGGATTTVTGLRTSISTTIATENTASPNFVSQTFSGLALFNIFDFSSAIARNRVSISGSTTYYLVSRAQFAVNSCAGYGQIRARRVR